jgi:hypothetical protein
MESGLRRHQQVNSCTTGAVLTRVDSNHRFMRAMYLVSTMLYLSVITPTSKLTTMMMIMMIEKIIKQVPNNSNVFISVITPTLK